MTDDRMTWGFITDVLDVLELHGFQRAEDEHTGHAVWLLSAAEARTIMAALDEASLYKRGRVAACADQSCGACQWRLQAAEPYDRVAVQMLEAAQISRSATGQRQADGDERAGR